MVRVPVRTVVSALSLAGLVYVLATFSFADRGYHFSVEPNELVAPAEEAAGAYDLSRLRILTRCVGYLRSYYVEPERIEPARMLVGALNAVQQLVPPLLVESGPKGEGQKPQWLRITVNGAQRTFALGGVGDLYEMNWKLLDIFEFLEANLGDWREPARIEYAAINGMLRTLDPHSVMLDPVVYREMKLGTEGEFGGVGIVISIRDGRLVILSVMAETPGARAGLKRGDAIVAIEGQSSVNMTLNEAVERLRGEPGTPVTVLVQRKDWPEPRGFTIRRDRIRIRSVTSRPLGRGVGYVHVKHFQQNTYDELTREVEKLNTSGHFRGLIVDLRDNPGGLLDAAIEVSDAFLDAGTIVTTVGAGDRMRDEKRAEADGTLPDVPLVLLVNGGSASASEIVAGALKNNDRALLLGERTFGKGSVQVLYDIEDAALKLTVAQYLTPGDRSIQSIGIPPDVQTVPVLVDAEQMDLVVSKNEVWGESNLPKHLVHLKARTDDRPAVSFAFLKNEHEAAPAPAAEASDDEEDDDEFQADAEIRFAETLLLRGVTGGRTALVAGAHQLYGEVAAAEDERIRQALGKLGVDWRPAPAGEAPPAPAGLVLRAELAAGRGPVAAGDKVRFQATLTNQGATPIYRAVAVTESDYAPFADRELVFGYVAPGTSRSWSLPVSVGRGALSRYEPVRFVLHSAGEPLAVKTQLPVTIVERPRPSFALGCQVIDESGNGDGLVQRGERFTLRLRIDNEGAGESLGIVATVKNLSGDGVFIHGGRQKLPGLAVGAGAHVDFDVEVQPTLDAARAELELRVSDPTLREARTVRVALPVLPTGAAPQPVSMRLVAANPGVQVRAGAALDSPAVAVLAGGTVVDVDRVLNGWARADIGAFGRGWLPQAETRPAAAGGAPIEPPRVEPISAYRSPSIVLRPDTAARLHVSDATLPLRATVRFAPSELVGPRSVVVYVNDDKVFYRRAAPDGHAAAELAIDTVVPLEAGTNQVRVYAQEGEVAPVSRTLIVYRDGPSAPAPPEGR